MSRLIVVVGTTGGQGGSVVSSFLTDPQWRIRGITRNLDSDKAKSLIAQGVEMVKADLNSLQQNGLCSFIPLTQALYTHR